MYSALSELSFIDIINHIFFLHINYIKSLFNVKRRKSIIPHLVIHPSLHFKEKNTVHSLFLKHQCKSISRSLSHMSMKMRIFQCNNEKI
jgi:hypothetical protein